MIISASYRTGIPALYSQWSPNRIKEGYVLVPNPFSPRMISKVNLHPAVVDRIVSWTKNPAPVTDELDHLQDYKYHFQFTPNPYGEKLENNLPSIDKRMDIFKRLSDKIGKEKVTWRYDSILTSEEYSVPFHKEAFAQIIYGLRDHTEKYILEFIDHYQRTCTAVSQFNIQPLRKREIEEIVVSFRNTINEYPVIQLSAYTFKINLRHLGTPAELCIDKELVEGITGYPFLAKEDKSQRNACNYIESIGISTHESYLNRRIYYYAIKGSHDNMEYNTEKHDRNPLLLIGRSAEDDIVKEREMKSLRDNQYLLF